MYNDDDLIIEVAGGGSRGYDISTLPFDRGIAVSGGTWTQATYTGTRSAFTATSNQRIFKLVYWKSADEFDMAEQINTSSSVMFVIADELKEVNTVFDDQSSDRIVGSGFGVRLITATFNVTNFVSGDIIGTGSSLEAFSRLTDNPIGMSGKIDLTEGDISGVTGGVLSAVYGIEMSAVVSYQGSPIDIDTFDTVMVKDILDRTFPRIIHQ